MNERQWCPWCDKAHHTIARVKIMFVVSQHKKGKSRNLGKVKKHMNSYHANVGTWLNDKGLRYLLLNSRGQGH